MEYKKWKEWIEIKKLNNMPIKYIYLLQMENDPELSIEEVKELRNDFSEVVQNIRCL